MTDSERIARQHSDEHRQAGTSPGAHAPGEEKPSVNVELNGGAAEVQGDLDELVKTAAERDEYLALAQRTQADFENYR
ncbi:MAG: hypothetical protein JWN81_2113 [Solirubrobacterales bacterium]|nr:hypothetical protein [Solirubrobacterales bacterium]